MKARFVVLVVFFSLKISAQQNVKFKVLDSGFIYTKASFPSAHASTIEELENGDIIAAWFGGTHERQVATGYQSDTLSYPTWNPVLFKTNNKLFLFYKIGPSPSTWWGAYKISTDHGKTWSEKKMLPEDILGSIKNKPIQLKNGRIVSPSSEELQDGEIWKAHMEISDDYGKTWRKVPVNENSAYKVIQPSIVQLQNGNLKAFFRSDQDAVLESTSIDNGETWSDFSASELANPKKV